jgi:cytochrome c oxidase subunit 1
MQNVDAINVGNIKEEPKVSYLTNGFTLRSWLLTKDHKRIAILYLITVSAFFALGGTYASLIRLELLTPASDLLESATYNKVFTGHGVIMVFFFLIPSIPAILGNFLIPIMIGEGFGVSENQSAELVFLYDRRRIDAFRFAPGRR